VAPCPWTHVRGCREGGGSVSDWIPRFREIVEAVPPDGYPDLAAECARAEMLMRRNMSLTPKPEPRDGWIDATQAGEMLGMSRSWVYERRDELGGRKLGGAVRFSTRRIRRYLDRGQA
jgi:predicted DNA-binding transcriptional regulator AlpA